MVGVVVVEAPVAEEEEAGNVDRQHITRSDFVRGTRSRPGRQAVFALVGPWGLAWVTMD